MIKHGKIHPFHNGLSPTHLDPIKHLVTRGVADSREKIVLQPMACDVRGAKRFNGQQCVIAKALARTMKPQGVAIGRSLAYAVFDGLAIRFRVPAASRKLVEEFDQSGRARKAPIELCEVKANSSWSLKKQQARDTRGSRDRSKEETKQRAKKWGVRAIGGGVAN